jgi:hypothetical protein
MGGFSCNSHDVPCCACFDTHRRESQHSPIIPVRYDKSLRHGGDELSQKKTGVFVTGTNNALYEWTDSNGRVKLEQYSTKQKAFATLDSSNAGTAQHQKPDEFFSLQIAPSF